MNELFARSRTVRGICFTNAEIWAANVKYDQLTVRKPVDSLRKWNWNWSKCPEFDLSEGGINKNIEIWRQSWESIKMLKFEC